VPELVAHAAKASRSLAELATRRLLPLSLALSLAACGTSGVVLNAAPRATPSPSPSPTPVAVSTIAGIGDAPPRSWTVPFGRDAPDLTRDADNSAALKRDEGLTFSPVIPKFGIKPLIVQASSTQTPAGSRQIDFAYNFPTGSDFPSDGHVQVLEDSGYTPSTVKGMVDTNSKFFAGRPEISITEISVGNSIPAYYEVDSKANIAEIHMSYADADGYIAIDITGVSLPPATCRKLANTFAS